MDSASEGGQHELTERRILRSQYFAVKSLISDGGEEIGNVNSNQFCSVIAEVEKLHQHVQTPREQVADAEALLDIATTLVTSVKSQRNDGLTPSDFVNALLTNFGLPGRDHTDNYYLDRASWERIGTSVSQLFMKGHGYCTMNGPMDTEVKPHKSVVHRKRIRPTESSRPEDVGEMEGDPTKKTDTARNMLTMFTILRKQKQAKLENLVLNRQSFAQTVENIFALSFLVKDGRVQITVDKNGHHFVSARNAPAAASIASGEVSYSHFVFCFDTKDWKVGPDQILQQVEIYKPVLNLVNSPVWVEGGVYGVLRQPISSSNFSCFLCNMRSMREMVAPGEELMPHRFGSVKYATRASNVTQVNSGSSASGSTSMPIKTHAQQGSGHERRLGYE